MATFFGWVAFILVLLGAAYWWWSRRIEAEVAEGAALEYEALRKSDPDLIDGYDEQSFGAVYRRVHFPRFPGYALAAIVAYIASLPVTLAFISALVWIAARSGLIPQPVEMAKRIPIGEGTGVAQGLCSAECQLYLAQNFGGFLFFFAIIAVWLAIFAFFMHRYHSKRPGYLRDELIRSRT